jgi:hypothetical protein
MNTNTTRHACCILFNRRRVTHLSAPENHNREEITHGIAFVSEHAECHLHLHPIDGRSQKGAKKCPVGHVTVEGEPR